MKLNEKQQSAVDTLDRNLSLTAGAGTGKTKVLTERFISILKNGNLTEGKEYDEVLSITFTNKAADEMKMRILKALSQEKGDEKFNRLHRNFPLAQIFTIHGFCTSLIKKYPLVANCDPLFTVAEDREAKVLLEEAVAETVGKFSEDLRIYELLLEKGYLNFNELSDTLITLYYTMRNKSLNVDLIKERNRKFNDGLKKGNFNKLKSLLLEYYELKPGSKFRDFYESETTQTFLKEESLDCLLEIENNLGSSKKERAIELRDEISREIVNLRSVLERGNYKYYELIVEMLGDIVESYEDKKSQRALLDYDDLQLKALEILKKGYGREYKYIMVDEFQDTNSFQVEILKALTDNFSQSVNLFVVGDEKQAIYSFRGGNVEQYRSFTEELKFKNGLEIDMNINYRSSKELLESFNSIFLNLMGKDKYKSLEPYNTEGKKIKTIFFEGESEERVIAACVVDLIKSGESPEDIAILFRKKKNIGKYENELLKSGIKVNNTAQSFFERTEIRDVLSLLKAVSNKRDYLSFLAFLKSPMVGLNENSIYLIGTYLVEKGDLNFDLSLLDSGEEKLYSEGIRKLKELRDLKNVSLLGELVLKSLEINRCFEIAQVCFGDFAVENLNNLVNLAFQFQEENSNSLVDFIDYVKTVELDTPPRRGEVNLVTIHKSKGLEYKTVIIAEMDADFTKGISYKFIQLGSKGLGINIDNRNSKYKEVLWENKAEQIEEEGRILYVAMTRAIENLILPVGNNSKFKVEIDESKDDKDNKDNLISKENSYLGLIEKSQFNDFEKTEFNLENSREISTEEKSLSKVLNLEKDTLVRESYIDRYKTLRFYSASSFMAFKKSPELFYRTFILKEDVKLEEGYVYENELLDPIVRGNIVHKYAQLHPKDIDEFISNELLFYGIAGSEKVVELLKAQFKNYDVGLKGEVLHSEYEFYYSLNNGVIHGYIDQVRKVGGEIEIIDFKSTYNYGEKVIKYYEPQLQIYTKAFEEISGEKVSRAKLIFLSDNKEYNVDISKNALNYVTMDFENFIDFVEKHRDFKYYNR
ncbi:UvrD-helicase domain-containing protein [Anaerosphaera multitolerans]|uniref:DNA 3'-5' helicase n=1 Tax=Anaerosphaera multitolerans TaxID=2487351 RepID=A0A437S6F1_9FIRM|nr:UvrD-helicase domain-containing protein [Anaerosphaera multitolerans]RVU54583.1 hypothetical protein EF514_06565 [Anaerosphaera multitolerans]